MNMNDGLDIIDAILDKRYFVYRELKRNNMDINSIEWSLLSENYIIAFIKKLKIIDYEERLKIIIEIIDKCIDINTGITKEVVLKRILLNFRKELMEISERT